MKNSSSYRAVRRGGGRSCFRRAPWVLCSAARRCRPARRQPGALQATGRRRAAGAARRARHSRRRDLPDGTVNFGRVPGEKGVWNVPYITNMAMRVVGPDGQLLPAIRAGSRQRRAPAAAGARGGGGGGGGRGGSKSEPWMPWMPWSAAVYDYNSKNESKYDPEGYCLPPGGPRMMATPYQMEIIQLPEHKRIMMIFEGATHIWREIYMDGRKFPEGDALNPDVPRLLGRPVEDRRHARRREQGLQREQLARLLRPSAHRQDARRRAVDASEQADAALRGDGQRPGRLHAAVHDGVGHSLDATAASCLSTSARRTTVPESPRRRSRSADLRPASAARHRSRRAALARRMSDAVTRCSDVLALVARCSSHRGVSAQFGHPLKGQWSGQWGPADSPKRLLLDLHWDGKEITGVDQSRDRREGDGEGGDVRLLEPVSVEGQADGRGQGRVGQAGRDPRGRHARKHRRLQQAASTAPGRRRARRASSRSRGISRQ